MSHQIDSMSPYPQIDESRYNAVYIRDAAGSKPPVVVVIDTQQTLSQQALEQSFLQQMHAGRLLIIVQATRVLLVAFIYPPYMILYIAPKWLFEKLQPFFSRFFEKGSEGFEKFLMRISAWSGDVFGIITHRAKALLLRMKNLKKKQTRQGDNLFQSLAKDIKAHLDQARQTLREWKNAITKSLKPISLTIRQQLHSFRLTLHSAWERFKNSLPQVKGWDLTVRGQIKNLFKNVSQQVLLARAKIEEGYRALRKKASQAIETLTAPLTHLPNVIKTAISAIVTPVWAFYQERIQAPIKSTFRDLRFPVTTVRSIANEAMQWMARRAQEGLNVFVQWRNQMAARTERLWVKAAQQLGVYQKLIAKKWRRAVNAFSQILKPFARRLGKILDDGRQRAKKRWSQWKQKGEQIIKEIKKWAVDQLRQFPSRLYRFYLWLKAVLYRGLQKFLWASKIALTWTKVLLRHSFRTIWLES